ncbi:MAG TPA: tripartite tricarboxylate transporter substrate-binding protein [Alphaproteobacteria bacterium]|jgi:tripartite-type tricarboxylate transporter receptor subunit TctC|nr:tripartite tricarboxylate transporter substrate-binding protein [Alphaproteobacteria bacterium]
MVRVMSAFAAGLAALVCAATAAQAQNFYAGKTVTIIVSTGGDDSYGYIARAFAQHMPRYIPGQPTMIVKAMPGAGNVLATNHLYNIAPKDGTTIGTINNAIPLHQVLDGRGVKYDASKFNWLGSTGTYNSVAYIWHTAGIKTIQDVMSKEVILGGTGAGSSIVIYPTVMNNVLGTKFKIVLGYKSVSEINIAMERGEVQARTGSYADLQSEHQDWLDQKKVVLLTQIGSKPDKAIPAGVPLVVDLAKTEEQRQILKLIASPIGLGRPYLAPPDVDKDRVSLLRKAFAETMADKAFLADMAKLRIDVDPVSGDEIARNVADTIGASPEIVAKAKAAMGEGASQ